MIQNNVRAWLLRKNYINLRDAAMTLQTRWRERKYRHGIRPYEHHGHGHGMRNTTGMGRSSLGHIMEDLKEDDDVDVTEGMVAMMPVINNPTGSNSSGNSHISYTSMNGNFNSNNSSNNNLKRKAGSVVPDSSMDTDSATTTLQRVTRGMLARKSFHGIKKQAIASLVIQRSMVQWWGIQRRESITRSGNVLTDECNSTT